MKNILILSLSVLLPILYFESGFAAEEKSPALKQITPSFTESAPLEEISPGYLEMFISPLKKPAVKIWLYSAPALIGLRLYREDTVNHNQAEIAQNNSLRQNSKYGDLAGRLYTNLAYTSAFGAAGYFSDPSYYTNAKAMFWASAMSGLTAQILKGVVQERRPPPHHDRPHELNSSKESFPSGHTTSAFTFASVVQQFHGWAWGAPAYAMGAFVGWSRMNDNKHYLHDVVFGAALGASYGVGVSQLYKKSAQDGPPKQSLMLIPNEDRGGELVYTLMF